MSGQPAAGAASVFGRRLLVSIPWPWLSGLRLPGSLFGEDLLRDVPMPLELRAALALVAQEARTHAIPVQFVARPEIFTHGRARAWLDDRIAGARDHVIITDGTTLRTIPGLRNHLFFYPRGQPAREDALRRLIGIVPELFGGLASQLNGALGFRCGGAWHRPPTAHLHLRETPMTGRVERLPFHAGAERKQAQLPPDDGADDGADDRPVHYIPLSPTAIADASFMRMLAGEAQRAIFGGPQRLFLELPRPEDPAATEERLGMAMRAFAATGIGFPRGPSWAVQFVTAPPPGLRPASLLVHPGIAFWRYGLDFYAAAGRVEVPVGGGSVTRFRHLLSGWLGRPVEAHRRDAIHGVPRVTLSEAP